MRETRSPERASVLLIGTIDTKSAELAFLKACIEDCGGHAVLMDVGVREHGELVADITNRRVAEAGGRTLADVAASADENVAMQAMTQGAVALAQAAVAEGRVQGVLALGGTMGTDLALDVTAALPLGIPKFLISTVAFSHLVPPERLAPDLMGISWAGGLYGLNSVCRTSLRTAANAVVGACRGSGAVVPARPMVAVTSLGTSAMRYIIPLKPALEERGFEVVVFHSTGMGGRAMEALASQGKFAAVLDFCLQEVANDVLDSIVTAGSDRLENAGRAGIPQIVAPGAIDMIDMQAWKGVSPQYEGRAYHAHNRLIASVASTGEERRVIARRIAEKLSGATGAVRFILPRLGIQEWDREGQPLHDPEAHGAFVDEMVAALKASNLDYLELDAHINDAAFADAVLDIFDRWVASGIIRSH